MDKLQPALTKSMCHARRAAVPVRILALRPQHGFPHFQKLMARKRTKGILSPVDEEQEQALRQHLQSLGLENVDDYKTWCRKHSFSGRLDKSWPQRQREYLVATREVAAARLAEYKKKAKFPDAISRHFRRQAAA